eukprot:EC826415.1.p1 GENE.EC826415.1~~EC826415.1.p1  ORF type:complete len:140 (+),score=65.21 EC826415.1:52-471(+)
MDECEVIDKKEIENSEKKINSSEVPLLKGKFSYFKDKVLGQGNFATVFLGKNNLENVEVAVKRIEKNKIINEPKLYQCLQIEMKTMYRKDIDRSHLLQLYDFEETDKYYFLIMELMKSDLAKYLKKKKKFDSGLTDAEV